MDNVNSGIQLAEGWFLGLFEFPFWLSFLICTLLIIIFLFATKQFRMYKVQWILLSSVIIPIVGMLSLLASLGIVILVMLYITKYAFFIFPLLCIVIFFVLVKIVINKTYKYFDDQVILLMSALIALIGNPVILFMWGYKEMFIFPQ